MDQLLYGFVHYESSFDHFIEKQTWRVLKSFSSHGLTRLSIGTEHRSCDLRVWEPFLAVCVFQHVFVLLGLSFLAWTCMVMAVVDVATSIGLLMLESRFGMGEKRWFPPRSFFTSVETKNDPTSTQKASFWVVLHTIHMYYLILRTKVGLWGSRGPSKEYFLIFFHF